MATRIQLRRDTAANFTSANPTLAAGELAYETDTRKIKAGDGSTAWTSLNYIVDPSSAAAISDVHGDASPELAAALGANNQNIGAVNELTANDVTANTFTSNGQFSMGGHILPTSNADYDIGSADYKVRHLFLSDNSLHIGDHAIRPNENGNLMNAKRDRSGGDPHINLTSIPSGTGAGQQRTFTTASDGNSIANATAIFSSMDAGSLIQFVGKADDGSLFGTWRFSSYSAGTSGASGSTIVCTPVAYNKASNDNISNAIFSPVVGTTNLVVEAVSNLIATGASDKVTLPDGLKLASGKTVEFGDVAVGVSGGELQVGGTQVMKSTSLATVATTGAYSDVTGTPTLATVATTGAYADVTGTPTLATVATSGSYNDLSNQPTSFADLTITGNLTVQGTKTELSTTTLDVEDKNITMSKGSASASASNGAGITVEGPATDATLIYNDNPEKWVFNKTPYFNASRILTTADVGTGAGLDADTLDGQEGSHYLDYSNFTNTPSATTKADLDVDHLITLTGVSAAAESLGTFAGSTIGDNQTIKDAIEALETSVETKAATASLHAVATSGAYGDLSGTPTIPTAASLEIDHLITLSGMASSSDNLGTFTGSTIADSQTTKQALQALETAHESLSTSSGTKITSLADDTTPELSGHLDLKSQEIQSTTGTIKLGDNTLVDGTTFANGTLTVNGNATFNHNVAITGQLLVNGSNTIINATTVSVDDPIMMLGGDTAPGSDDNKDRGVLMRYHTGSAADMAFMGWDDSASKFVLKTGVTATGEVTSGDLASLEVAGIEASGTINAAAIKIADVALHSVATSGSYNDLANKPTISDGTTQDNMVLLTGLAGNSVNYGTSFTGSTIADNSTILDALQALESKAENNTTPLTRLTESANVKLTSNSTHFTMENFTGSTIADNSLIHEAFQSLETAVETKLNSSGAKAALDVDHLITLSGVSAAADHLGTFSGSTINDNVTVKTALQALETAVEAAEETAVEFNVDHIITLTGVASASDDLGTFTGSTISDNVTIKAAIQALETSVETKTGATKATLDVDHLITLSGVSDASDHLGTFSGSTIDDNVTVKAAIQALETAVEAAEETQAEFHVDHLVTLSGVAQASDHLGTFTGSTITDNQTIKAAIQLLETEIEQSYRVNTSANFTMAGNITFNANIGFQDGVSYLTPPKWTTTQRDNGSSPAGQVIYNTTTNRLQVSNGSIWMEMADSGGATTFQSTVQVDGDFTAGAGIVMSASAPEIAASNNSLKLKYTADSISNCMGMSSRENIYFAIDNNNNTTNGCLGIRFNADIGTSAGSDDMDFAFKELDANEFKFQPKDARAHIQHSAWTSTERDNATQWSAGAVIWNSTTSKLQVYNGSAWVDLH